MFKHATFLLKGVILFVGVVIFFMAIMLFPEIWSESSRIATTFGEQGNVIFAYSHYLLISGLYGTVIPFAIALYQGWKLLKYIEQKKSFSDLSVHAIGVIKKCGIVICGVYMIGVMPLAYLIADIDDAPDLIIIAFLIGLAPFIVATFAAILQTLLQEAIVLKSEQELTI